MRKPIFEPIDWSDKRNFRAHCFRFWIDFWWTSGFNVFPLGISWKYFDFWYHGTGMFYIFPWARKGSKKFCSPVDWISFDTFEEYHRELKIMDSYLEDLDKKREAEQKELNSEKIEITW